MLVWDFNTLAMRTAQSPLGDKTSSTEGKEQIIQWDRHTSCLAIAHRPREVG